MTEENGTTSSASGYLGKKSIARFSRGGFDRNLLSRRDFANIRGSRFKIDLRIRRCRASASLASPCIRQAERLPYNLRVVCRDQFFNKPRISGARSATELVIQMADDQFSVAALVQPMQQRN
jgi:hypothetical protein